MKSKILNSKGQILQNKEIVWTNLGRLKLFLVFLGIILFFVFFIMNSIDNRQIEYDLIKNNNQIISGKIIKIGLFKGHHVRVQFKVKDITYTGSDGFDTMEGKEVGDSIYIKYYVKDPNIFITELNDEF